MFSFFRNIGDIVSVLREIMDVWDEHGEDVLKELRQLWKEANDLREEIQDLREELGQVRGEASEIRQAVRKIQGG